MWTVCLLAGVAAVEQCQRRLSGALSGVLPSPDQSCALAGDLNRGRGSESGRQTFPRGQSRERGFQRVDLEQGGDGTCKQSRQSTVTRNIRRIGSLRIGPRSIHVYGPQRLTVFRGD